ncbi:MAG TPA: hypothetical protein VK480_05965 [Solirubrobacterales bacterium]|nr:hypothetical protein [Solirubrobacterales bacterium]
MDITPLGILLGLIGGVGGTALTEVFRLRKRPRLSLVVTEHLYVTRVGGNPAAFARLEVRNAPGKEAATGVTVRIEGVASESEDHRESLKFLESWQLAWANDDRGNTNVPPKAKVIASDSSLKVDLAHLNTVAPGLLIVDIRPQPEEGNYMNRLGPGTFQFELVVGGDNASARRFRIALVHDGQPWDGAADTAVERVRLSAIQGT